jgi:hypothetical protein
VDKRILEVYLKKTKFCPIIPQFVAGKGKDIAASTLLKG